MPTRYICRSQDDAWTGKLIVSIFQNYEDTYSSECKRLAMPSNGSEAGCDAALTGRGSLFWQTYSPLSEANLVVREDSPISTSDFRLCAHEIRTEKFFSSATCLSVNGRTS